MSSLPLSAGFEGDAFASRPCNQTRDAASRTPGWLQPKSGCLVPGLRAGWVWRSAACRSRDAESRLVGRASVCREPPALHQSCQAEFAGARREEITCAFVEEEREQTAKTSACLRYRGRNPPVCPVAVIKALLVTPWVISDSMGNNKKPQKAKNGEENRCFL